MKGLLQKDFYLMRTLARSYAFILGVFFLLSLTGVYDGTFLCTFLVLMCVMIPANTFSYDCLLYTSSSPTPALPSSTPRPVSPSPTPL